MCIRDSIGFKHDDASQRSETWLDGRNVEHRIREMDVSHNVTLAVSYTHLRAHETVLDLVCRLLLEKKK